MSQTFRLRGWRGRSLTGVYVEDSDRRIERGISERSMRSDEEKDGLDRPSAALSIRSPELWDQIVGNVQPTRLERRSSGGVGDGGHNVPG
jgi:hypothetical protein